MRICYETLTKQVRKMALRSDDLSEGQVIKLFLDEIEDRQRRKAKKSSSQNYNYWTYYISYNGRLARVPNSPRNPIGERLKRKKELYYDDFGVLRADEEIPQGQFVKHRALIEELDPKENWSQYVRNMLEKTLDGGFQCSMTIDRQFDVAYEPRYHDDFCLEGDLVTGESCMSGDSEEAQQFYGGIDGCYVCRFENNDGEQVGRCIMYDNGRIRHFIRIYAKREYARCALRLLRKEMRDGDVFGRSECISLDLPTNWEDDTPTMYLDGDSYGVRQDDDGSYRVTDDYQCDLKYTGNISLASAYEECDYVKCDNCGIWTTNIEVNVDGYNYCCCECAEADGYRYCDNCEEWCKEDNMYELPDGSMVCCESCAESMGYYRCQHCDEWHTEEEMIDTPYGYMCSEDCCVKAGLSKCDQCGEWFKITRRVLDGENQDKYLCENCASENGLELVYKTRGENND